MRIDELTSGEASLHLTFNRLANHETRGRWTHARKFGKLLIFIFSILRSDITSVFYSHV